MSTSSVEPEAPGPCQILQVYYPTADKPHLLAMISDLLAEGSQFAVTTGELGGWELSWRPADEPAAHPQPEGATE